MSRPGNSFVYSAADVSRLLGLPAESTVPAPRPELDDEIVVYYAGWSLADLRTSTADQKHELQGDWYDHFKWKPDAGYYRVLLTVTDSNHKCWNEQVAHLAAFDGGRWHPAPVAVAATALLVHLEATGQSALQNCWFRCAEQALDDRVGLMTDDRRVKLGPIWNEWRDSWGWLAAALKVAG